MNHFLENIGLLSDLLTLGAPVLFGLAAAAYLALLLSWKRSTAAHRPGNPASRR